MFVLLLVIAAVVIAAYAYLWSVLKQPRCKSAAKLHGKVVIVTGANTGIGKATALDLARRGARVIMACRDQQRTEAAIIDIVKETGSSDVVFMPLDLASLQSVRSFAEAFLKSETRLDILINNAGLVNRGRTVDGFGMIFGVNHLGHFLLTLLLLDRLRASGPSRVVTVSSQVHHFAGRLDFDCLNTLKDFFPGDSDWQLFGKYCGSKLCNVLFTHELAKRLRGADVTCYSVHPGEVLTGISRHASLWTIVLTAPIGLFIAADVASGAQTPLHCALQEGIEHLSGRYFSRCAVQEGKDKATDDAVAEKLWEVSEKLCGVS